MPAYAWTCQVCESTAPADSEVCPTCFAPSVISGKEILRRRRERAGLPSVESTATEVEDGTPASPVIFILFGIACIVIGGLTLFNREWPIFFTPPQLDVIALPLMWLFGPHAGAYVVAIICFVLGGGALWIGTRIPEERN